MDTCIDMDIRHIFIQQVGYEGATTHTVLAPGHP